MFYYINYVFSLNLKQKKIKIIIYILIELVIGYFFRKIVINNY